MGQKSANDDAQNQSYPRLEQRIADTYAAQSSAALKNSLYDSYIKAFRWASDRLDKQHGGIIAFVSNGYWLDGNAMDGFRKSLEAEFSAIYVFNLRGNCRTSGEVRRKESGNVFGLGSRTPIAITVLVKKPGHAVGYMNLTGAARNSREGGGKDPQGPVDMGNEGYLNMAIDTMLQQAGQAIPLEDELQIIEVENGDRLIIQQ